MMKLGLALFVSIAIAFGAAVAWRVWNEHDKKRESDKIEAMVASWQAWALGVPAAEAKTSLAEGDESLKTYSQSAARAAREACYSFLSTKYVGEGDYKNAVASLDRALEGRQVTQREAIWRIYLLALAQDQGRLAAEKGLSQKVPGGIDRLLDLSLRFAQGHYQEVVDVPQEDSVRQDAVGLLCGLLRVRSLEILDRPAEAWEALAAIHASSEAQHEQGVAVGDFLLITVRLGLALRHLPETEQNIEIGRVWTERWGVSWTQQFDQARQELDKAVKVEATE